MGRLRRKTPIEIYLRDFRRRRQSRKSIIMKAYPDTYLLKIAYYIAYGQKKVGTFHECSLR